MNLPKREIKNFYEIQEIINKALLCHIGFVDNNKPYVLPLNFAYDNKTVYLHTAPEGKKNDILLKNNNVCISFDIDAKLYFRNEDVACSYGMNFRSVIISGKAIIIEDYNEKIRIMNLFMKKYTGSDNFKYNPPSINNVKVYKVEAVEITGIKC
jgi:uncharacterized protein